MKPSFFMSVLHSWQGLGLHLCFAWNCWVTLIVSNVQGLKPKFWYLKLRLILHQNYWFFLCLHATTWSLLRLWVSSIVTELEITGDIPILTLKISVAKYWRFLVWVVTYLSFSSSWKKVEHLLLHTMRRALFCC